MIALASSEIFWAISCREEFRSYPKCGIIGVADFKVIPVTSIISRIEGAVNTAVGKIKQNADGHSFDKEGTEQEQLGKSQLSDSSAKHNIEKDG